jgi:pantothenate kinase-related protein Tda10
MSGQESKFSESETFDLNLEKQKEQMTNKTARPFLIGVSGGSASGKTSVSQIMFKLIGIDDCVMISMDSYYKDLTYIST